jgi:hypothetical protein
LQEREELSLCSLCGKSVEEACICQQDKTVEHPPPETNTNELQKRLICFSLAHLGLNGIICYYAK